MNGPQPSAGIAWLLLHAPRPGAALVFRARQRSLTTRNHGSINA